MSKSEWTQQRHARTFQGQGQLTGFGFKAPSHPTRVVGLKVKANLLVSTQDQLIVQPLPPTSPDAQIARPFRMRSTSVLSDLLTDDEAQGASGLADVNKMDTEPPKVDLESLADDINDKELEDWKAELNESVQGLKSHIWDWTDL